MTALAQKGLRQQIADVIELGHAVALRHNPNYAANIRCGVPMAPDRAKGRRAAIYNLEGAAQTTAAREFDRRFPTEEAYNKARAAWKVKEGIGIAPKPAAAAQTAFAAVPTSSALAAAKTAPVAPLPAIFTVTRKAPVAKLCEAAGTPFLTRFLEFAEGLEQREITQSPRHEIVFTHAGRTVTVMVQKVFPYPSAGNHPKIRIAAVSAESGLAEDKLYIAHLAAVRNAVSDRDFNASDKRIVELGAAEAF